MCEFDEYIFQLGVVLIIVFSLCATDCKMAPIVAIELDAPQNTGSKSLLRYIHEFCCFGRRCCSMLVNYLNLLIHANNLHYLLCEGCKV